MSSPLPNTTPHIITNNDEFAKVDHLRVSFTNKLSKGLLKKLELGLDLKFGNQTVSKDILDTYKSAEGLKLTNSGSLLLTTIDKRYKLLIICGRDCEKVKDWTKAHKCLSKLTNISISRIDLKIDVISPTVDEVKRAYYDGQFDFNRQRPPIDQINTVDGKSLLGKSIAIGKRNSYKYLRCYEKGTQDPQYPSNARIEVEIKKKGNYKIDLNILLHPHMYFCGAYRYLGQFSNGYTRKLSANSNKKTSDYQNLINSLKNSYGSLIKLMMDIETDPNKVIDLIIKDTYPKQFTDKDITELKKGADPDN